MNVRRAAIVLLVLASCGRSGGAATPPLANPLAPPGPPPFTGVRTVAPESVIAGATVAVQCLLLDENGAPVTPPADHVAEVRVDPAGSVAQTDMGVVARRAGSIAVACRFPDLGLADAAPDVVQVLPGPPASVLTTVDRDSIAAGEEVTATCTAVDAFGNPTTATPSIGVSPTAEVEGAKVHFERSGLYEVACDVPGAASTPAQVEVVPGSPATLTIEAVPDEHVYARDQIIEVRARVADALGNPVATHVLLDTGGAGEKLGELSVRFPVDGLYTLTASVPGTTLTASLSIRVDSSAPGIVCDSPADGAILDLAAGSTVNFQGRVRDDTGVASLTVNGTPVTPADDGSFSVALTAGFGVNFVDLAATDVQGAGSTRTCAFLAADSWAGAELPGAISLQLRQEAIDDGKRTPPMSSLGDMLAAALGSSGLHDTLDSSLKAASPLKASSCDQRICIFGNCVCLLSSEIDYLDNRLPGPNTASLSLGSGGLPGAISFQKPGVKLRVRGSAIGIPYDTSGWVDFASVDVKLTFDLGLSSGRPRMSVRKGSVTTKVGAVSTSFAGLTGAVLNIVASLASGSLQSQLSSTLQSFVSDGLDAMLDGVFSGLDPASLASTFDVPLPSGGSVPLSFAASFTSADVTPSRVLLGLGTSFTAPPVHAGDRGAPLERGPALLDPATATPMAVSLHVGALAQAVDALWSAGFFDQTLDTGSLSASLTAPLPPAVRLADGRLQLSVGSLGMKLSVPGLLDGALGKLGLRVSLLPALDGGALKLTDMRVDELHFSTEGIDLDAATRDALEPLLSDLLGQVLGSALGGALPALPVPSFKLPASVSTYGLPAGAVFGLAAPALGTIDRHLVLTGATEVR